MPALTQEFVTNLYGRTHKTILPVFGSLRLWGEPEGADKGTKYRLNYQSYRPRFPKPPPAGSPYSVGGTVRNSVPFAGGGTVRKGGKLFFQPPPRGSPCCVGRTEQVFGSPRGAGGNLMRGAALENQPYEGCGGTGTLILGVRNPQEISQAALRWLDGVGRWGIIPCLAVRGTRCATASQRGEARRALCRGPTRWRSLNRRWFKEPTRLKRRLGSLHRRLCPSGRAGSVWNRNRPRKTTHIASGFGVAGAAAETRSQLHGCEILG